MAHPHLTCPSRPPFICFICFSLCVIARGQEPLPGALSSRSPHGLAYQAPTVLSPAAFEFFHPAFSPSWANSINGGDAGTPAGGAPPPIPASPVHEKVWPAATGDGSGAKAGRVAGVMLGAVSAVLLACGVYCILRKRGTKAREAGARCLLVV